eukprot:9034485-Alexandrium_andersonii.AAC.1
MRAGKDRQWRGGCLVRAGGGGAQHPVGRVPSWLSGPGAPQVAQLATSVAGGAFSAPAGHR